MTLLEHLQLCREYRGIWAESKADTYGYLFREATGTLSVEEGKRKLKNSIINYEQRKLKNGNPQHYCVFQLTLNNVGDNVRDIALDIANRKIKSDGFCQAIYQGAKKLKEEDGVELNANEIGSVAGLALYDVYEPLVSKRFKWKERELSSNGLQKGTSVSVEQEAFRKIIGIVQAGVTEKVNVFTKEEKAEKKLSNRTFVVDQEYSYSKFTKAITNIRSELVNAWACRVEVEKCFNRIEELMNAEAAAQEEDEKLKESTEKPKGEEMSISDVRAKAREYSEMEYFFYKKAKETATKETKKYRSLHKPREKSLAVGQDKDFPELKVDEGGRIVLPIGEEFYPTMFEIFLRSHMPPLPAFTRGRGVQAQAEYEISGRELRLKPKESLTRKEKAQLQREEKEWKAYLHKVTTEFRNFKDRLSPNKADPINIRLLNHMTSVYTVENHKYVEAFEMLSRSNDKIDWNETIKDWLHKYDQYVKWAAKHLDYYYMMYATNVNTYSDQHNAQSIIATGSHDTPELQRARAIYEKWKAAEEKRKAAAAAAKAGK